MEDAREQLAAYAHDAWAGWMKYLFRFGEQNADGTFAINADKVARWQRQMMTPYAALPEEEKHSDRKEADQILEIAAAGPIASADAAHDAIQEMRNAAAEAIAEIDRLFPATRTAGMLPALDRLRAFLP